MRSSTQSSQAWVSCCNGFTSRCLSADRQLVLRWVDYQEIGCQGTRFRSSFSRCWLGSPRRLARLFRRTSPIYYYPLNTSCSLQPCTRSLLLTSAPLCFTKNTAVSSLQAPLRMDPFRPLLPAVRPPRCPLLNARQLLAVSLGRVGLQPLFKAGTLLCLLVGPRLKPACRDCAPLWQLANSVLRRLLQAHQPLARLRACT